MTDRGKRRVVCIDGSPFQGAAAAPELDGAPQNPNPRSSTSTAAGGTRPSEPVNQTSRRRSDGRTTKDWWVQLSENDLSGRCCTCSTARTRRRRRGDRGPASRLARRAALAVAARLGARLHEVHRQTPLVVRPRAAVTTGLSPRAAARHGHPGLVRRALSKGEAPSDG
jgi:hypothetical protein